METSSVAPDNSKVLTVKLGRETSLVAHSTDKRSKGQAIRATFPCNLSHNINVALQVAIVCCLYYHLYARQIFIS